MASKFDLGQWLNGDTSHVFAVLACFVGAFLLQVVVPVITGAPTNVLTKFFGQKSSGWFGLVGDKSLQGWTGTFASVLDVLWTASIGVASYVLWKVSFASGKKESKKASVV